MLERSAGARFPPWRPAGWLVTAAAGGMCVVSGIENGIPLLTWAGWVVLAAGGFGLWCVLTLRYEVSPFDLVVRAGPLRRRIPLECVQGVIPVRRTALGFPPNLEYLAVAWVCRGRERVAHVFAGNRREFIEELAEKAPFLERRGDRLVRAPATGVLEQPVEPD